MRLKVFDLCQKGPRTLQQKLQKEQDLATHTATNFCCETLAFSILKLFPILTAFFDER